MRFDKAFDHLMDNEGVLSNDPYDSGGKTIYGIASKKWPADFEKVMHAFEHQSDEAAKIIAKQFYKRVFWDERSAFIPDSSIVFRLFDFGVNAGTLGSNKVFQKSVNDARDIPLLKVDGIFGAKTLKAATETNQEKLYVMFCINIYMYYLKRPTAWIHLRGWKNRLLKRHYLD